MTTPPSLTDPLSSPPSTGGSQAPPGGHVPGPPPRASTPLKWLMVAGAAGFVVLLGSRIKERQGEQAAVAKERQATGQRVAAAEHALRQVEVVRPVAATWRPTVAVEGTLQPWHEADLSFKASGRLSAVRVKVGDKVKAGASLAQLDSSEAAAQRRAAEAQLKASRAQLALAQDNDQRTSAMVTAGAVGEATGTQVRGQLALVGAQVEAAQAQLAIASLALGNHALTAPFAGLVTRAPTGPGAVVGAGTPLIHLQDTTRLRLVATVSESDAGLVQVGDSVEIPARGGVVRGTLIAAVGSVDGATRRVPVEAEVANDGAEPLLSGVFVRAAVSHGQEVRVLRLPATARRPGSQDEVVVVAGGKLAVRRVTFATAADGALLVRSGVSEGDDVVAVPASEVHEGEAVTVVAAGTAAPASSVPAGVAR